MKYFFKLHRAYDCDGIPSSNSEFSNYRCMKTHDLDVLLSLTGIESAIRSANLAEWSAVGNWNPESRYDPTGAVTQADATLMIKSAKKLIDLL